MDGTSDPFASITELCHVSASQEDRLRHCPFARESDDDGDGDDERVDGTGILMVSLPDSSTSHDVFQTPPEGSVFLSSEEQGWMAVGNPDDREVDGPRDAGADQHSLPVEDGGTDGAETVDLAKDSDIGYTAVELARDSDLGFVEVELAQRIDDDLVPECEPKKLGISRRESSYEDGLAALESEKSKVSAQNLASEAPEACVGARTGTGTEISDMELESESRQNVGISEETAVEANVLFPAESSAKRKLEFLESESKEGEGNGCRGYSREHIIETIERLQYVSPSKLRETANASGRYPSQPVEAKRVEITILDVLRILKEEDDDDEDESLKNVSIVDICKQRGVTFCGQGGGQERVLN